MEFKNKLKQLRGAKGVSQQTLADAIFVSRSAVAKWENGLGLPSDDSLEALADFFEIDKSELCTSERDARSIEKSLHLHRIGIIIKAVALVLLFSFSALLTASVLSDSYGLTPELAAGEFFRDNEYFDEGDYRIYYGTMSVTLPDGGEHEMLSTFRPLRKIPLGYKLYDEDYRYRIVYLADNYTECAIIYSLKGKDKYYNLIMGKKFPTPDPNLIVFDEIVIDGTVYEVEHSSYFVTENCPSGFVYIDGYRLIIGNELIIPNANRVLE